jgi:hypothetical protein
MANHNILYTKEDFVFIKNKKNNYSINFKISNNNILLSKIIDFNLFKLIYDLNIDIYEKILLNKINDNEAIIIILMKNLYEDLGLSQCFSYVHITKYEKLDKISFISKSIKGDRPEGIPNEAEQLLIENIICEFNIKNPYEILFNCCIIFENTQIIPSFVEKMIGLILFKIFKRLKQFIETVTI